MEQQQPLQPQIVGYTPPTPYKRPIRFAANIIGLSLLVLNFSPYILVWIERLLMPVLAPIYSLNEEITFQARSMVYYIFPFVLAILVAKLLLGTPAKVAFPLRKPPIDVLLCSVGIAMGASLLGAFLTNSLSEMIEYFFNYTPYSPDMDVPRGFVPNLLFFIHIAILPAILEEGLFRGVILQSLRQYGDGFALIISSILFGFMHGNLVQMPYTLLIGLVIGYFVLYTGSMWPGVLIHFANNGLSVVMDWITVSTTETQDLIISVFFLFLRIGLPIICLIILRVKRGSLFYVPKGNYPVKEKEKYISFFSGILMIAFMIYCLYSFAKFVQ